MAGQQPGSLASSAVNRASSQLAATAAAYDAVADLYANLFRGELDRLPLDQAMLAAFAQYVRASGGGPVAELGCGPGQTTGRLRDLELDAFGIGGARLQCQTTYASQLISPSPEASPQPAESASAVPGSR
jgi:hypothetical protein